MSSVRQIYLNTTLILVLLLIYAVLLVPLLGQNILWRANMQEESHRWDKAYLEYQQLIKLIPFSSKHVAEYGDFLVRLSASSTNPLVFLKPAVNIYKKAVLLNPLWAKAYLSLGLTELELGTREDKQYILSGINNIKKAIYYDPNGIDISYFAGDRVLSIWRFLSETEKEFVLDRLRYTLDLVPSYAKYIFPRVWKETRSFAALKRVTPPNYKANLSLYKFITENNLWQFRREQASMLCYYHAAEQQAEFEREQKNKQTELEMVRSYRKAKEIIEKEEWVGKHRTGDMYSASSIMAPLLVQQENSSIHIRARGTKANGIPPYMIVEVDGKVVGESYVYFKNPGLYVFNLDTKPGVKVLRIKFVNDLCLPKKLEDRNLFIERAWVENRE